MQAIERTFGILRALADHPGRPGVSEIARRAGLPKSTTSRILSSLESLGVVERIGDRFAIGSTLATLTHDASPLSALRDLTRPHLAVLADTFGENASLVVDDDDQALYLDTVTPSGNDIQVQVQDWTGERVPFHTTAPGVALMSGWTAERPITSDGARRKLAQLRADGVTWTLQEFADDVNGVAAPIYTPDGAVVGAINVYGPSYRFPGARVDVAATMIDTAERIGGRLGTDL